jgi:hypothetical protein
MPKAQKPFEFRIGDRKNVPGLKNVQGVITMPASGSDFATAPDDADGRHHLTFMRWFDERGQAQTGWFPVPEVLAANARDLSDDLRVGIISVNQGRGLFGLPALPFPEASSLKSRPRARKR